VTRYLFEHVYITAGGFRNIQLKGCRRGCQTRFTGNRFLTIFNLYLWRIINYNI